MNLRCVVTVEGKIESVLECKSDLVFVHIEETFKSYHEDVVSITVTRPMHMKED